MQATLTSKSSVPFELSFNDFIFQKYRLVIWITPVYLVTQFAIFKLFYPYPNFIPDSYGYLESAMYNWDISIWPVGYSKFLRIFSALTNSDNALVLVQYLFLEAATLYFVFTILYQLRPGKLVSYALIVFSVINPLLLSISNYVSTDALFTGASLIWVVQLLWILYRPRPLHIWTHAIALLIAFTMRYNALYYPFVAVIAFMISRLPWRTKIAGIALSVLFIGTFIWHCGNKYKELIGVRQFSAFGGWQMASNALFMYSQINDDSDATPAQFATLHKITRRHMDSLKNIKNRPDSVLGIYYLWDADSPLRKYMKSKWSNDEHESLKFEHWAKLSKLYSAYGLYLIRKHPLPFAKYYLLPNTINYYIPPAEFLDFYNVEGNNVRPLAMVWFEYKSTRIKGPFPKTKIFSWYSILITFGNGLFFYSVVMFLILKKTKTSDTRFLKNLLFLNILWIANFFFSVFSSPIVLRYQIFPMIFFLSYGISLLECVLKADTKTDKHVYTTTYSPFGLFI